MKILGNFIDCIYEPHLYEHNMADIRNKLVNKLPDRRICELASVLMIDTKYDMYAVKIRMCYTKEDGSIDIEKIHNRIMDSDFIEISMDDYTRIDKYDYRCIMKRTNELVKPGTNVIYKMDIDVDTLI